MSQLLKKDNKSVTQKGQVNRYHGLITEAFLQNPYPTYQALRTAGPIHWCDDFFQGGWVLTSHEDIENVLRNPQQYSAQRTGAWLKQAESGERRAEAALFQRLFARAMLFLDQPDHDRIRRVLRVGFHPHAIRTFSTQVEALVIQLLDTLEGQKEIDFVAAIARPLPSLVISHLMGVAVSDQAKFIAWSDDLAAFISAPRPTPALLDLARKALTQLCCYFEMVISERLRTQGEDLVSRLVQAKIVGQIHSQVELMAQCAMLLLAGHETTRNLLSNGLYALLNHPEQWERLKVTSGSLTGVVHELLRYDSPVQYTARRVVADTVLHGQQLRRGELVIAMIGAANRDPARYFEPDRLDVCRREGSHLSFGHGPHVCLGAGLAVMEVEITLRHLIQRWPQLQLVNAGKPCWNGNAALRGLSALPITLA